MSHTHARLKEADDAYARGDFPTAREAARTVLAAKSLSKEDADTARQIIKAIDFDPIAAVGFGITLFLLIFLGIKFLM